MEQRALDYNKISEEEIVLGDYTAKEYIAWEFHRKTEKNKQAAEVAARKKEDKIWTDIEQKYKRKR